MKEFFEDFKDYLISISETKANIKNHCSNAKKAFNWTIGTPSLEELIDESDINKQLDFCDEVLDALRRNMVDPKYKTYSGCMQAVNRLKEFISTRGTVSAKKIHKKKTITKSGFKPCLKITFGEDGERDTVFYEDVPAKKQVPNLCGYIEMYTEEIIRRFRELFREYFGPDEEFNSIPVILSADCPSDTWEKNDKYLAKEISKLSEKDSPLDYKEVYEILKNRTMVNRLLGEFISSKPCIKIYYMNFDTSDSSEFFAMIYNTLAHEYMHYFEYKYCMYNKVESFMNKNLSESLSEMFALIISIYRKFPEDVLVANKRFDSWVKHYDSGWPYADALNFFIVKGKVMPYSDTYLDYVDHGSIDKLRKVFEHCITPDYAYKILLAE